MVKSHGLSKIVRVSSNSNWAEFHMSTSNNGGIVILQVEPLINDRKHNLLLEIITEKDYCYGAKAESTDTSVSVRGSRA